MKPSSAPCPGCRERLWFLSIRRRRCSFCSCQLLEVDGRFEFEGAKPIVSRGEENRMLEAIKKVGNG